MALVKITDSVIVEPSEVSSLERYDHWTGGTSGDQSVDRTTDKGR